MVIGQSRPQMEFWPIFEDFLAKAPIHKLCG
jgi:hypothetical protein